MISMYKQQSKTEKEKKKNENMIKQVLCDQNSVLSMAINLFFKQK